MSKKEIKDRIFPLYISIKDTNNRTEKKIGIEYKNDKFILFGKKKDADEGARIFFNSLKDVFISQFRVYNKTSKKILDLINTKINAIPEGYIIKDKKIKLNQIKSFENGYLSALEEIRSQL